MYEYNVVGINSAEEGGADSLGSNLSLADATTVAKGAVSRYEACIIRNQVTGAAVKTFPEKSKAA